MKRHFIIVLTLLQMPTNKMAKVNRMAAGWHLGVPKTFPSIEISHKSCPPEYCLFGEFLIPVFSTYLIKCDDWFLNVTLLLIDGLLKTRNFGLFDFLFYFNKKQDMGYIMMCTLQKFCHCFDLREILKHELVPIWH